MESGELGGLGLEGLGTGGWGREVEVEGVRVGGAGGLIGLGGWGREVKVGGVGVRIGGVGVGGLGSEGLGTGG